ncbi:unnamed protein product [Urochloa decumbens]|uniref:F-box domain-containing protein n=1 Tax=Urochloa decumbens TaxID=240449 RepID=A0ABC8VK89_9POAL
MEPPAASGDADDLISGLPDSVLHTILIRLASVAAAARTSVLSRRWRSVWNSMPELDFGGSPAPARTTSSTAVADSIDAALSSSSTAALRRLKIHLSNIVRCNVPADRVVPWLLFASKRVTGRIDIHLPSGHRPKAKQGTKEELALPVCERATEIDINLSANFVLRPPPTGSFRALTDLRIMGTDMDGGELGRFVSTQCPRLRKLSLFCVRFAATDHVSIRSESLECLQYHALDEGKLEVTTPMLLEIHVHHVAEAYIVAPKLEKVDWGGKLNPNHHQFAVAPSHLRSLSIVYSTWLSILISSKWLMQRFNTVSELQVSIGILKGIVGYKAFVKDMDKLPTCETLSIHLIKNNHGLAPMMVHLLKRCSGIRKLKLFFDWRKSSEMTSCTTSGCPCLLRESYMLDDITFDSLEEIKISLFSGSTEEEEFMKLLLSRRNMVTLKRVDLTVPFAAVSPTIMEVIERIQSTCYPNREVQFSVRSREVPKPLAF